MERVQIITPQMLSTEKRQKGVENVRNNESCPLYPHKKIDLWWINQFKYK